LRVVATSKSTGSGHLVWPDGCGIEDVPDDLMVAIEQAVRICSWLESFPADEVPPRWMWHLDWKVDDWFKEVDRRRDAKFKGSQSSEHEAAWREMDEDDSRVGNVFAQQLRDG